MVRETNAATLLAPADSAGTSLSAGKRLRAAAAAADRESDGRPSDEWAWDCGVGDVLLRRRVERRKGPGKAPRCCYWRRLPDRRQCWEEGGASSTREEEAPCLDRLTWNKLD